MCIRDRFFWHQLAPNWSTNSYWVLVFWRWRGTWIHHPKWWIYHPSQEYVLTHIHGQLCSFLWAFKSEKIPKTYREISFSHVLRANCSKNVFFWPNVIQFTQVGHERPMYPTKYRFLKSTENSGHKVHCSVFLSRRYNFYQFELRAGNENKPDH